LNLRVWRFAVSMLIAGLIPLSAAAAPAPDEDAAIAESLAQMLRAARTVISDSQARIDDANVGDKGLGGPVVLDLSMQKYRATTGVDPPRERYSR